MHLELRVTSIKNIFFDLMYLYNKKQVHVIECHSTHSY